MSKLTVLASSNTKMVEIAGEKDDQKNNGKKMTKLNDFT